MTPVVEVCQSDYIAADDLGGKVRTLTIKDVRIAPDMPGKPRNGKKSKSVLIVFEKARKGWIVNTTNQWSIALLLGTKTAVEWIGKRVALHADMDIDIESKQPTACIRVQGSPDATPERAKAYATAWKGERERGALVKRVKRELRRLALGNVGESEPEDLRDDAPVFEDDDAPAQEPEPTPVPTNFETTERQPGDDVE